MAERPDDLQFGSFSDSPPWSMKEALTGRGPKWLEKVPVLRAQQARFLPELITPPRIPR